MDHRARSEEQQRLEERVREHVEHAGSKRSDAERQEHVSQAAKPSNRPARA